MRKKTMLAFLGIYLAICLGYRVCYGLLAPPAITPEAVVEKTEQETIKERPNEVNEEETREVPNETEQKQQEAVETVSQESSESFEEEHFYRHEGHGGRQGRR